MELPAFLPLTALSVGRHASTNHSMIFLWVSGIKGIGTKPGEKKLVVVVVQDEEKKQPATMLRSSWAFKNSPFFAPETDEGSNRPLRGVCSFEIHLDEIAGLDYWNPLLVDASRVVIEARSLTRRWFPDLRACQAHFAWDLDPSVSFYQPQAPQDGAAVTMSKVELRTENCKLHTSPSKVRQTYWQPRPEEASYARLNALAETAERLFKPQRCLDDEFAKAEEAPAVSKNLEVYDGSDGGTGSSAEVPQDTQHKASGPADIVEILYNRTVNFRFDDPFLPYVLREVIHDPDHHRLLRLCEAGIPAWAIVLPKFTGLYHRYMRHLVAAIVVLVSCLSMLLGFYDLYKRIPLVRSLLKQSLGPLSSKLEELVVVRLSFLLGWILPYNTILRRTWHCLQMLWDFVKSIGLGLFSAATMATSFASSLLQPATSFFFSPVISAASASRSVFQAVATTGHAVARLFSGGTGTGGLSGGFSLLRAEFNMARQAFMSVYNSTCFLGATLAKHQASTSVWFSRWRHRQWRRVKSLAEWPAAVARHRPLCFSVLVAMGILRFCPGDFAVRCGDALLWDLAVVITRCF